jgi:hypothetical protein
MFIYPSHIIEIVKKNWDLKTFSEEKVTSLPDDQILSILLETSYHASLLTEESRRIGFRIIYISKKDAKKEVKLFLHGETPIRPIYFENEREFNVNEILRLAPATEFTQSLICVEQTNKSMKNSKLAIWGILDAGSSWYKFIHAESSYGDVPPNFLTISSSEPGNITISRAGNIILNLKNGKVIKPTSNIFDKGPVAIFFEEAKNRIYNDVLKILKSEKYDPEGFDDDYPKREYIDYLERIIFNMRQKNHGGTIIIVPDYMNNDDSRLIDRVSIKYPCNYNVGWELIVNSLVTHREYYDLYFPLWDGKKELSIDNFRKLSKHNSDRDEIEESLSDSVRFIASLSGVDGAVILTDKLRVLGFGAEIISLTPSLKEIKIAKEASGNKGKYTSIDNFGTRHRSAFRFCSSYEESVAIIISQDGSIKVVKRVGPDLILWPDINVGFYGI